MRVRIEHCCGHAVYHQVPAHGPGFSRKCAALWQVPCRGCGRARNMRLNENHPDGLPPLRGYSYEITWALDIRERFYRELRDTPMSARHRRLLAGLLCYVKSARQWIEWAVGSPPLVDLEHD